MKVNKIFTDNILQIKSHLEGNDFIRLDNVFDIVDIPEIQLDHKQDVLRYDYLSHSLEFVELENFIKQILGIKEEFVLVKIPLGGYSLLNDDDVVKEGYDIIFDITQHWDKRAGGSIIYPGEENVVLEPSFNTLYIVKRSHRFFQYVNHYGHERLFFINK